MNWRGKKMLLLQTLSVFRLFISSLWSLPSSSSSWELDELEDGGGGRERADSERTFSQVRHDFSPQEKEEKKKKVNCLFLLFVLRKRRRRRFSLSLQWAFHLTDLYWIKSVWGTHTHNNCDGFLQEKTIYLRRDHLDWAAVFIVKWIRKKKLYYVTFVGIRRLKKFSPFVKYPTRSFRLSISFTTTTTNFEYLNSLKFTYIQ